MDLPKAGQAEPGISTKIGPQAVQRGPVEILRTIIHEEIHHWLEQDRGINQFRIRDVDALENLIERLTNEIIGPYQ